MAVKKPGYTYTGSSEAYTDGKYWYILLKSSGTLTMKRTKTGAQAHLVGGGGAGAAAGGGGAGGKTTTAAGLTLEGGKAYDVTVGAGGEAVSGAYVSGGPGGDTQAFGHRAEGGAGGNHNTQGAATGGAGGSGGGGVGINAASPGGAGGSDGGDGETGHSNSLAGAQGGAGQGTTTRDFGETTGTLRCGGGGGIYAPGGEGGGGAGQTETAAAEAGAPNTGGGGGAGLHSGLSGAGGSGVVILRGTQSDALPITFQGVELERITFNGVEITGMTFNGTTVFSDSGAPSGPAYTNQVPLSVDKSGSVFNGTGYMTGYRVRSSGELGAVDYTAATGYIPVKAGDVVRMTAGEYGDFDMQNAGNCVLFADSAFAALGSVTMQPVSYGICQQAAYAVSVTKEESGVWMFTVPAHEGIRWLRLSMMGKFADARHAGDMIVTVNEVIA